MLYSFCKQELLLLRRSDRGANHSLQQEAGGDFNCPAQFRCSSLRRVALPHAEGTHPDLSLGTVYRNLLLFQQQGVIQSVGVVNGQERFDADTTPHSHFVCTTCGA